MESELASRLASLMQPWCRAEFIHGLLGLELTSDPKLMAAFRSWANRFRSVSEVERSIADRGTEIHRHHLEAFLVQNGLISWKWAAVYLGMTPEAMMEVVDRLSGKDIVIQLASSISDQLIRQRDAALLFRAFPNLRGYTFSNHSKMCRALHDAIRSELGIEITPVVCVTSKFLEEAEPDIAAAFDALTFEPVGFRYQVWLDTKKPMSLRPDVCSLKLYAKHESELRRYVMKGSEPERIDARLTA